MATNRKVSDVIARAQSNLNDSDGQLWTSDLLLPKVRNAYEWLINNISKVAPVGQTQKVQGLPYSADIAVPANTVDITALCPADLYLPTKLEYRLDASQDWTPVEQVSALSSQMSSLPANPTEWVWLNRSIKLNPCGAAVLLRLTYLSLLPELQTENSDLLVDNAIAALAYYTAADAFASRGQTEMAVAMRGGRDPSTGLSTGAVGFVSDLLDLLVLNEQYLPRRGAPYSASPSLRYGGVQFPI